MIKHPRKRRPIRAMPNPLPHQTVALTGELRDNDTDTATPAGFPLDAGLGADHAESQPIHNREMATGHRIMYATINHKAGGTAELIVTASGEYAVYVTKPGETMPTKVCDGDVLPMRKRRSKRVSDD